MTYLEATMGKSKSSSPPPVSGGPGSSDSGGHSARQIQIRVPAEIAQALDELARTNRRHRNQEILIAIESRLIEAGLLGDGSNN